MVVQFFLSHTKLDEDFCDRFDILASRVGVKVLRSEYETIQPPAWQTIQNEMNISAVMFLLVGKELVNAQALSETDNDAREKWKYTQNWISYEVGLTCQQRKDIWQ